ncbi:MAG: hypothetical protein LBQ56_00630 [Synergistaceae bacterium]|jgi:hypothetical protein|nr:hypothetical protein [Synergistaceae bacterium]
MSDSRDLWMVGDVLDAMSGPNPPDYVLKIVHEIQTWLATAVSDESEFDPADIISGSGDRQGAADLEYLFTQLEWAGMHADLVPVLKESGKHEDAVILSIGPILLDEGLRMMVDHAALFASGTCRKIWLVSDTWIIGDVLSYIPHIKALLDRGIQMHFLLVTPWGYSEIPWTREK